MRAIARFVALFAVLGVVATYLAAFAIVRFFEPPDFGEKLNHTGGKVTLCERTCNMLICCYGGRGGSLLEMWCFAESPARDDEFPFERPELPEWTALAQIWPDGLERWEHELGEGSSWREIRVGWPFEGLYGRHLRAASSVGATRDVGHGAMRISRVWGGATLVALVPFIPLWPAFGLNVAAWGGLFAALYSSGRGFRRWRRRRAGRCAGCGYDVRASPEKCPECGRPVGTAATRG